VNPEVPTKLQAYRKWQRETLDKVLDGYTPWEDRQTALQEMWRRDVSEAVQGALGQYVAQQTQQQKLAQTLQGISDWAFQKDQSGQVAYDVVTGKPLLTPQGQVYGKAAALLEQYGVTDPTVQDALCQLIVRGVEAPQAGKAAAPVQADPRREFSDKLRKAGRVPQSKGTFSGEPAEATQNPGMRSWAAQARQLAKRVGMDLEAAIVD
jgi:hypothetical protein